MDVSRLGTVARHGIAQTICRLEIWIYPDLIVLLRMTLSFRPAFCSDLNLLSCARR